MAARRIVDAFDPIPGEALLEIGPGLGALTTLLVERAGRVAAVEIDRALAALLRERFGQEKLVLVEGNVLDVAFRSVAPLLGLPDGSPVALVGNLPYHVSKPIASKLVHEREMIGRAVLMFQREVAERLTARPGSRAYGPLAVLVGEAFRVERRFDVPPSSFRPAPKVRSSVTLWTPRPAGSLPVHEEEPLRRCLACCFAHRRQTLRNNLRAGLPGGLAQAESLLAAVSLDGSMRAEDVSPEVFRRLAAVWPPKA